MILYIADRNIRVDNADNQISYNSDYIAEFRFDEEWNGKVKTARFVQNEECFDIVLVDDRCEIPPLKTGLVRVGVFTDSMTSTYADVYFKTSIKDGSGNPTEPPKDVYAQLIELIEGFNSELNKLKDDLADKVPTKDYAPETKTESMTQPVGKDENGKLWTTVPEKVSAFENDAGYLTAHQDISGKLDADKLPEAVNDALAQAAASGEFDGADGKSAYQYAVEGGYTKTEVAFAEKLAQEQLTGTADELTPTQVYDAVSSGIPVKVQYTDSTYGIISFTAFSVFESLNVIASNIIAYYNGVYILAELFGDKSGNTWGFMTTTLAQKTDIPSAVTDDHINSLIDTKLGVIENGAY